MLKTWKFELFFKFMYYMFLRYVLNVKTDLTLNNFYGQKIILSNDGWSFNMLMEILFEDIYKWLSWCNHFLDIWWFIWESGIYFAQNNKKVTIYEADPDNYKYLVKNVSELKNIISYNLAVVWDNTQIALFYKNNTNDPWTSHINTIWSKSFKIQCINYFDIIKNNPDIDGIKIDIEWWEYQIVPQFNEKNFTYKKWQIEFHDFNEEKHAIIMWFLSLLENLLYVSQYLDVNWNNINSKEVINCEYSIFTLYFYKNS